MKRFNDKKLKPSVAVLTAAATLFCSSAIAQSSVQQNGFASLEAYLGSLYVGTLNYLSSFDFQKDPHLKKVENINTAKTTPTAMQYTTESSDLFSSSAATNEEGKPAPLTQESVSPMDAASIKAAYETSANLTDTLKQFPYIFNPNSTTIKFNTVNGKLYSNYFNGNTIQNLTVGTSASLEKCNPTNGTAAPSNTVCANQASDTVFTTNLDKISMINRPFATQPASTNADNYFNFAALMYPANNAYTPEQALSAKQFVKYAGLSTQDFTSVFTSSPDFTKLLQKGGNHIAKLKHDTAYQQFMLQIRSILAIRSVSINAIENLIAERTPMPNLGTEAGLKTNEASPLQVEAYQATHRIESKKWYQDVQNEAPATVQRNTLILLAEIEQQNYQAHLDRERILAQLAALTLTTQTQNTSTFILQSQQGINQAISNAVGGKGKASTTPAGVKGPGTTQNSTDTTTTSNNTVGTTTDTTSTDQTGG